MKTGILTTKTIASDDIRDTKSIMGMSSKGMEMAQYFLRDKIYSDKILAVIREYISNAYDEHVKHGITKDVDINLKSENSQWVWSVRDYAMGLNDHDIRNIFGVYFESTKSNENNSIGGFGIGGKAGFSYTDTFYVTSYHNGLKTSYVCTLGAGTKGIPVGEIYEISKEPTTEQGIEIGIEVKPNDLGSFATTTETFVKYFTPTANIKFNDNYCKELHIPSLPIDTVTIGEYTFSTYDDKPHYGTNNTYFVRMGGVVYPFNTSTKIPRNFSKYVIVDVPIGKLSIPISRESIENTPLNDKVYIEIEKCLDQISIDEVSNLVTPKFGSVITGHESIAKTYDGAWFSHSYSTIFPQTRQWYYKSSRFYNDADGHSGQVSKGPKHMVYLVPDIKSVKNWHKRIINALKIVHGVDYCGYVSMRMSDYNSMLTTLDNTIDISDCVFVDVKTLKLPKLENTNIDRNSYQVCYGCGNKEYYTAEELDKHVINTKFGGADLEDDWYLETKNMGQLQNRTIGLVSEYGTRSSHYTANSIKMVNALKDLGWLTPACPEYKDMAKKFKDESDRKDIISRAEYKLKDMFFGDTYTNNRVLAHIKKNPEKIDKLLLIKSTILKENSTRGRVLSSIRDYNRKVTRQDIRKIMTMKD
jgi:hypothetical protein